jgi:hypothetical protein
MSNFDENFYADLEQEERGAELQEQKEEDHDHQREAEAYPSEGNVY